MTSEPRTDNSAPYGGLLDFLPADDGVDALIDDNAFVAAILRFEAALATAQAEAGVIPDEAAAAVRQACAAYSPDPQSLGRAAAASASPVVAIVRALGAAAGPAASWVHYGATSQDCIDTAFSLCLHAAAGRLGTLLDQAISGLRELATAHAATPMTARSLGQSAAPTTFGFKVCGWLEGLRAARRSLAALRLEVLAVQCGGAVGTLAAMGPAGPAVVRRVAELLDLQAPSIAWHSERSRFLLAASTLTGVVAAAAKIATDVILMAQAEVGELTLGNDPDQRERGGSSAMPHKRNPVAAILIRAAAVQSPGLLAAVAAGGAGAHERAYGEWQAEWRPLRELAHLAGGAVYELTRLVPDLAAQPEAMRVNLERGGGVLLAESVTLALAPSLGRSEAHRIVQAACQQALADGRQLAEVLKDDQGVLDAVGEDGIDAAVDPGRATDAAAALATTYLHSV